MSWDLNGRPLVDDFRPFQEVGTVTKVVEVSRCIETGDEMGIINNLNSYKVQDVCTSPTIDGYKPSSIH
jgi:hypothetical protein